MIPIVDAQSKVKKKLFTDFSLILRY
jgi:hypothetical protein